MPQNNIPENVGIITMLWVLALSLWGGTVHTIRKVKEGVIQRFSLSEWIGDVTISGFIGVVTYALCKYSGFDEWLTAVCVGVTSHQGTRGLLLVERIIAKKLGITEEIK